MPNELSGGINSLISLETYEKGNFHVAYYDVPTNNLDVFQNNPLQPNEDIINTTSKTYKIIGIIERPAINVESFSALGYISLLLLVLID